MELVTILLRTILSYFVVLIVMRIMGKREIGKLSIFDLVISIMIAEIAVLVIEDVKKPMIDGLLPIFTLVAIQIIMSKISLKSRKLRLLFDGPPSILVENGKINKKEMKKQKYTLDDLMLQLRQNDVMNIADVEYASLETTGKLTVVEKQQEQQNNQQHQKKKSNPKRLFSGIPLSLIMDGEVMEDNLVKIHKNRFWLKDELQERGISDFKYVFLCSIDNYGKLYIDVNNPNL